MANMSYCRFHNTLQDLQDCAEHMEDDDLSEEEARARTRLIKLCARIVEDYEWLRPTRTCTACNGSGHYDRDDSPTCGACDGSGVEFVR
jgi:hypothetical protein